MNSRYFVISSYGSRDIHHPLLCRCSRDGVTSKMAIMLNVKSTDVKVKYFKKSHAKIATFLCVIRAQIFKTRLDFSCH
jgi:hypothetical protein